MRWFQKPCSRNRILDYHSFHPHCMKINVVNEFIRNSLKIISPQFWDSPISRLEKTLSNSNYSRKFIRSSILSIRNEIGTVHISSEVGSTDENIDTIEMCKQFSAHKRKRLPNDETTSRVQHSSRFRSNKRFRQFSYRPITGPNEIEDPHIRKQSKGLNEPVKINYIGVPFYPPLKASFSSNLRLCDLEHVRLAPKPVRTNERIVFTSTKSQRHLADTLKSLFSLTCEICKMTFNLKTDSKDIVRTIAHHMHLIESPVHKHLVSHLEHFFGPPTNISKFNSKRELDWVHPFYCTVHE